MSVNIAKALNTIYQIEIWGILPEKAVKIIYQVNASVKLYDLAFLGVYFL